MIKRLCSRTCPSSSLRSDVIALAGSFVISSYISTSHSKNIEPKNFCNSETIKRNKHKQVKHTQLNYLRKGHSYIKYDSLNNPDKILISLRYSS